MIKKFQTLPEELVRHIIEYARPTYPYHKQIKLLLRLNRNTLVSNSTLGPQFYDKSPSRYIANLTHCCDLTPLAKCANPYCCEILTKHSLYFKMYIPNDPGQPVYTYQLFIRAIQRHIKTKRTSCFSLCRNCKMIYIIKQYTCRNIE